MTLHTPNWLQQGSYAAANDRDVLGALWPGPASTGLAVTAGTGVTVNVAAGRVAVPSSNNSGTALCTNDAPTSVTMAAADGALNRIDLVIAQLRANDIDGGANNDWILTAVTGTAAASPNPPAAPANAVALAQIYRAAGSASIVAGNITDVRPGQLSPGGTPPPVAPGAALQSFVDGMGTLWVARGGVNGGVWRQARDVLFAHYVRMGAINLTAAVGSMPYDTAVSDPYGLYNPASGVFTVPAAGLWRIEACIAATFTAAAQNAQTILALSAPAGTYTTLGHAGAAVWSNANLAVLERPLAAGATVTTQGNASGTIAVLIGNSTRLNISYRGTG